MPSLSLEELRSPPRRLSPGARIRVSLSGTIQLIGWGFLAIGILTTGLMIGAVDLASLLIDDEEGVSRPGEIVSVAGTSITENEERVMELRARYLDTRGEEREVASYVTGQGWQPGESVSVLDFPGRPEAAVIDGARRAPLGLLAAFVLIFPVVGAIFVIMRLRVQGRWVRLLREGEATRAVLKAQERTGSRVNEQPVMKLTFEYFDDEGGSHTFSVKTHQTAALIDEPNEAVLYDPKQPALGVPLDLVGTGLEQDPTGQIVASRPGAVVGLLLRPIIVLAIGLAFLIF